MCQFTLFWHAGCFTGHNLTQLQVSRKNKACYLPSPGCAGQNPRRESVSTQGCTVAVKIALGEGAESSSLCTELSWICLQRSFPDKIFTELDFSIVSICWIALAVPVLTSNEPATVHLSHLPKPKPPGAILPSKTGGFPLPLWNSVIPNRKMQTPKPRWANGKGGSRIGAIQLWIC